MGGVDKMNKINKIIVGILTIFLLVGTVSASNNEVTFGWITDFHYTKSSDFNTFTNFISKLESSNANYVIGTGDLIDINSKESDIKGIVDKCKSSEVLKCYYTLGNQEIGTIGIDKWLSITGMDSENYYIDTDWGRFIFLNTQLSLSSSGLEWLKSTVDTKNKIVVFNHIPLDGGNNDLSNDIEIRRILESKGNVVAVFSGHIHTNSNIKKNNIMYLTQSPMEDGDYSIVKLRDSDIQIIGYGSAASITFSISNTYGGNEDGNNNKKYENCDDRDNGRAKSQSNNNRGDGKCKDDRKDDRDDNKNRQERG